MWQGPRGQDEDDLSMQHVIKQNSKLKTEHSYLSSTLNQLHPVSPQVGRGSDAAVSSPDGNGPPISSFVP